MIHAPSTARLVPDGPAAVERFEVVTRPTTERIPQLARLDPELLLSMRAVAEVLPFRVNRHVIERLIDWERVPEDPLFQLTFPQPGMLEPRALQRMRALLRRGAGRGRVQALARELRAELNPHPAGQRDLNVPRLDGRPLSGLQHKYPETVLYFPSHGQTCHAYCTFCFRWAQFVGDRELRIAVREADDLRAYLRRHGEVSDLLVTGGDPLVMRTRHLEELLVPLLRREYDHVQTIRLGTKSLTFWPRRWVSDDDADDLLRLLERLVAAGKHVAVMVHQDHWAELRPDIAREAVRRIRATGATLRSQAPLLAHVNDDAGVWARMWREQVRLGIVPYYMFVERDTGARRYFEVPLARAWTVYRDALRQVSGLGRTARGPSMSAGPGKVEVQGVTEIEGERVFVLRFLQARRPEWVQRPFFARFDARATWLGDLRPALGAERFFYEREYEALRARRSAS